MPKKKLNGRSYRAADAKKKVLGGAESSGTSDKKIRKIGRAACMQLKSRFPQVFEKMGKQVKIQRSHAQRRSKFQNPLTAEFEFDTVSVEFVCLIANTVIKHRRRYAEPRWRDDIESFYKCCVKTTTELETVLATLKNADPQASEMINSSLVWMAKEFRLAKPLFLDPCFGQVTTQRAKEIREIHTQISIWGSAAQLALGERLHLKGEKLVKSSSRPTSPYLAPTLDLIRIWEITTGCPPSSPKNSKRDGESYEPEAAQRSTEFVRLALLMIDKNLSPKESKTKAVTAIKFALRHQKEVADFSNCRSVDQIKLALLRSAWVTM